MSEPEVSLSNRGRIIIVEGNISAGKSTLCRDLAAELGYTLFLEPVVTNPYLELYYGDPVKYGLDMQLWLLRQRFIMYCRAIRALDEMDNDLTDTAKGVVLDRSLMSDVVFADKNLADGNISPEGYAQYSELRNHLLSLVPLPDCVVYLDATAKVCHERIHGLRKRDCESGIPLAYLEGLDECYLTFLKNIELQGSVVLKFDWRSFSNNCARDVAMKINHVAFSNKDSQIASFKAEQASNQEKEEALVKIDTEVKDNSSNNGATMSPSLSQLVQNDETVLSALKQTNLPESCCDILNHLVGPDLAHAKETLKLETKKSVSEEGFLRQQVSGSSDRTSTSTSLSASSEEEESGEDEAHQRTCEHGEDVPSIDHHLIEEVSCASSPSKKEMIAPHDGSSPKSIIDLIA